MNRLEGRVALVTGAASGIGKATAARLSAEGAAVLITDIQVEAGEATVKELNDAGGRAAFFKHDVTSESDWEAACARAVEEFGSLDILVNNAGMGDIKPIEETTLADWDRTVSIDQTGVFLEQSRNTPIWDGMTALTPMGHLGRPEDIAAGGAFLASDDAAFITGLELYIDGGYMAR